MSTCKRKKNFKLICSLLILTIIMQIVAPLISIGAELGTIEMKTNAIELKAGDTIELEVYLKGDNFAYFEGYLSYDTTVFDTIVLGDDGDIVVNPELRGWTVGSSPTDSEFFSVSRDAGSISCNGLLVTITLRVLKDTTSSVFRIEDCYMCNEDNEEQEGFYGEYTLPAQSTEYNITYDANLSSVTESVQNMPEAGKKVQGATYTIPDTIPTRLGYNFVNWNTKSDGSGTTYVAGNTYSTDATLILYAQWEEKTSTLTINPNGGTYSGSTSITKKYNETIAISDPTSAPDGYVIRFNTNGGIADSIQITQTSKFDKWLLTGGGVFDGQNYTFDGENGTLKAQYIGQNIKLPTATKTGATFKGWYTSISGGTYVGGSEDTYIPNANTTLFAQWDEINYTLTVNPNGGTYNGTTANSTIQGTYNSSVAVTNPTVPEGYTVTLNNNGETKQVKQTMNFDKWIVTGKGTLSGIAYTFGDGDGQLTATYTSNNVELETPTKEGYTFDGWYTLQSGGTKVTSPYMPTSNITLYAHWTANTYTITFDPGQGTVAEPTKTVTYDETYGTLPTPTRPGYEFVGWKNSNNETINSTDTVKIKENTTLTAEWLGAQYTVTFDYDGGTPATPESKTVRNEGKYGELPEPTKQGYTFKGWYNSNEEKIESTSTVNLTSDETLKAKWEANKYTITFNPGEGATIDETTREVKYGDIYGRLPEPTKPGYEFEGWYNQDGDKIQETDVIDILTDITLTAKWTGKTYILTFDYNGGTGNETSRTIQNGLAYGTLPTAQKEGYTFKGWLDENGQDVQGSEIVNTISDITLTANYEINKYKVTFKNDDGSILKTEIVEHGSSVQYTGNTPVKANVQEGYEATFNGWTDSSKLSNITEDITVIATYTISPKVYTITYNNLKNSDNSANPSTYTIEDENITLVDLPNQEKYIFKGWYTSDDETGTKVTSIDTSKLGNIILYAQWENDSLYLKSKKYKVGENDIDNYEDGDIYLDKIQPETTLSEFINNCDTNGTITVINEEGQVLSDEDLIGTNMTIKVTKYDEEITLKAVVMGDLDGNGKVTATDLSALNQNILKVVKLEGAVFKAADLDDNNRITATDLSTENSVILKNITLTYVKPSKTQL